MSRVRRLPMFPASLAVFAAIPLCGAAHAADTVIAPSPTGWTQPANLGQAELDAAAYHDSGAYGRDLATVDDEVGDWLTAQAPHTTRPALVLDIDETALSNWDEMKANGFGYIPGGPCSLLPHGPCGFEAWERLEQAPALAPTLRLYKLARTLGIAVFFITGRHDELTTATAITLQRAGYEGWAGLVLEPAGSRYVHAADFKAPARAAIEAHGYTILATVGDQRSDLTGGHAVRGFLLPNPFYLIP